MPHRIDLGVQHMQTAGAYSTLYSAFAKAYLKKLHPRNDAVLTLRQASDLSVSHPSLPWPSVCDGGCRFACAIPWHARRLADLRARMVR